MEVEFADVDCGEERLRKRFVRTMETLSKHPDKSIWTSSKNRAEAKAIYHMLANEKFDREEVLKAHQEGTVKRIDDRPVILAVQDTTGVNYDGQQKMKGNGYISDKTMGENIHTCLAVTTDGLVLGMLDQMGYNREVAKNEDLTKEQQKNRPIEEKESNRWLETMEKASEAVPENIKLVHTCDREGDRVRAVCQSDNERLVFPDTDYSE